MRASSEGWWGGGLLEGQAQRASQHKRQDVMVYSAQERGRRGQGAPCPQHHPQRDLWRRWQTPLSTGKSLKTLRGLCTSA